MFFTLKLIKNVIFTKTKNTRVVSFFIYIFYVCATFHTNWSTGCKVIRTLVSALKIEYGRNFHGNELRGIFFIFFSIFFILIIINTWRNKWVDKWAKQFLERHRTIHLLFSIAFAVALNFIMLFIFNLIPRPSLFISFRPPLQRHFRTHATNKHLWWVLIARCRRYLPVHLSPLWNLKVKVWASHWLAIWRGIRERLETMIDRNGVWSEKYIGKVWSHFKWRSYTICLQNMNNMIL